MNFHKESRSKTLAILSDLGHEVPPHLPMLELDMRVRRDNTTLAKRLLALHGIVGVSFDWSRRHKPVSEWLEREELWDAMTSAETEFVKNNAENPRLFQWKLEGLFGLAWATGLFNGSILSKLPDDFVDSFPKVLSPESTLPFRKKIAPRASDELIDGVDLLYCLDSAMVSEHLRSVRVDGNPLHPIAVRERRRALEWLYVDDDWDDIELDT